MSVDLDAGANAINVAVDGSDNNVYVNVFPAAALDSIRGKLASEFSSGSYTVMLCAPSDASLDADALALKARIRDCLLAKGITVVLAGGEEALPINDDAPYEHIKEVRFVEQEKCNSIVFIACDSTTFSQLSLLTHVRYENKIESIDLVVIPKDEILASQIFLANGAVAFADNLGGKVWRMSEVEGGGLDAVIERIYNRKLLWAQRFRRGSR